MNYANSSPLQIGRAPKGKYVSFRESTLNRLLELNSGEPQVEAHSRNKEGMVTYARKSDQNTFKIQYNKSAVLKKKTKNLSEVYCEISRKKTGRTFVISLKKQPLILRDPEVAPKNNPMVMSEETLRKCISCEVEIKSFPKQKIGNSSPGLSIVPLFSFRILGILDKFMLNGMICQLFQSGDCLHRQGAPKCSVHTGGMKVDSTTLKKIHLLREIPTTFWVVCIDDTIT